MPQVPVYSKSNTPLTSPDSSPLRSQQISVNSDMFGAGVAKAQVAQGSAIESAGEQMFKRAVEVQELKNQTDARDASNKFIEEMGQADLQYRQLEGKAAVDGYQAHVENIKKIHDKYTGSMGNDSARRYFLNDSSRQLTYNIINSSHWAANQGKKYRSDVNSASVQIAKNNAATQTDDLAFSNSISEANGAIDSEARNSNWSPERTQVERDKHISEVWSKRLQTIAMTDSLRAQTLYDKNKSQIRDAEQRLAIEKHIQQSMFTHQSKREADAIVNGVSTPASIEGREAKIMQHYTAKFGKVGAAGITANAWWESGQTYDPKVLGDNGASLGIFQHNTDRKAALIKYANEHRRNPADIQTQLDFADHELSTNPRFAGVAEALRAAKTPEEAAKIWHDRFEAPGDRGSLRARQGYAAAIMGRQYSPIGLTPNTTPGQLNEMLNQAEVRAEATMPGNEEYARTVKSHVQTYYGAVKKQAEDIRNIYKQDFAKKLEPTSAGGKGAITLDQLVEGDPKKLEAWYQLEPRERDAYRGAMEKNAAGRDVKWSPERSARANELFGMADTNPEAFRKVVIANEDLPMLGEAGILALQKKQRELNAPVETAAAAARMTETAFTHVRTMVAPLGITNAPKVGEDTESNRKSNMFVGAFNRDVEAFYKREKRAPNATESRELASNLIRVQQESSWRNWTNEERLFEITVPDSYVASMKEMNPDAELNDEEIRYQYINQLRTRRGQKWNDKTRRWQN